MIRPHGSDSLTALLVKDSVRRAALEAQAVKLPQWIISSAAAANAVMLGAGYFTPLTGFMNKADALSVATDMRTSDGLFWPVPVLNLVADGHGIAVGSRIALRDPNVSGDPVIAIQEVEAVEELTDEEIDLITQKVYRTVDPGHPGVATFSSLGRFVISGPIEVLNLSYFESEFPDTFRTAGQIREEIAERGWETVVAFQTRNPMHRAHEELCKIASDTVGADGGYGFDMLYAGPREAVLHALFRQNAGCTHLIVGRDHAGVGDFYGAFDAQEIFDEEVPSDALDIEIFRADHTAYSKKLNRVVMMRDAPDHQKEDFVLLSGTRVREMLAAGEDLPLEFARPEVARILMDHYAQGTAQVA